MKYEHVIIFGSVMVVTWFLFIYCWPRMLLYVYKRAILGKGFGEGPHSVNTLYIWSPQRCLRIPSTRPLQPQNWRRPA